MNIVWDIFSQCCQFFPAGYVPNIFPSEDVTLNDRSFRVLKQLGEGGYAFVYLVREVPTAHSSLVEPDVYALKKVIAATGEQLTNAKREIEFMQLFRHPNLLPLLQHAVLPLQSDSGLAYIIYMLTPAYQDGTLVEELDRLRVQGRMLPTQEVLHLFSQVCQGIQHMHSKGIAHRDIKPHNVLITRPEHSIPDQGTSALNGDDDDGDADETAHLQATDQELGYEAVVMDFGSARQSCVQVTNRLDALALQEDAEAHCTATYRAPEVLDVPSHCTISDKVDVWSLGCTLYHIMYGASPFQEALDQGASLPLAVLNCRIPWPKDPDQRYPAQLHSLIQQCLTVDPAARPNVAAVLKQVQHLQQQGLPNPACCRQ
eukprot:jgi/Chrzof1/5190/Cz15g15140.t1